MNISQLLSSPAPKGFKWRGVLPLVPWHRNRRVGEGTTSLTHLHHQDECWRRLCLKLSIVSQREVQANAYHSFKFKTGLPAHFDLYPVLLIQVEGNKRWELWPPVISRPYLPMEVLGIEDVVQQMTEINTPIIFNLKEGDALFIPHGWVHRGQALSDSLHVTLGFPEQTRFRKFMKNFGHRNDFWVKSLKLSRYKNLDMKFKENYASPF